METIAVYQETIIKTYGLQVVEGLSMLLMRVSNNRFSSVGSLFSGAGPADATFHAVFSQWMDADGMEICLLIEARKERETRACVQRMLKGVLKGAVESVTPVDLICFQGPHFGDRYGIAQAVFQALEDPSIPVLASEFSQSAVTVVLPGGSAEAAKGRLSEIFQVPPHHPIQTPIQTIRSDKRE